MSLDTPAPATDRSWLTVYRSLFTVYRCAAQACRPRRKKSAPKGARLVCLQGRVTSGGCTLHDAAAIRGHGTPHAVRNTRGVRSTRRAGRSTPEPARHTRGAPESRLPAVVAHSRRGPEHRTKYPRRCG